MALSIQISNRSGEVIWTYQWAVSDPGIGAIESAVLDAEVGVSNAGIFGSTMYSVARSIDNITKEPFVRDINLSSGLTVSRV